MAYIRLAASTKGWNPGFGAFSEFTDMMKELNITGIELHNVGSSLFTDKNGDFYEDSAAVTIRNLKKRGMEISCIDTLCDIADGAAEENLVHVTSVLEKAARLHIPFVRLRANLCESAEAGFHAAEELISAVLPSAKKSGVTLLIETAGIFTDPQLVRSLLDTMDSDNLAVLWQVAESCIDAEVRAIIDPVEAKDLAVKKVDNIINFLGPDIRYVHMTDASIEDGSLSFALTGHGIVPLDYVVSALLSLNYTGYFAFAISSEKNKNGWVANEKWKADRNTLSMMYMQFRGYMRKFFDNRDRLFWNNRHTGRFPWRKESLIEATFSDVLDRMVKEFPDQRAFSYSSENYTRTYSQFRDDVDNFARVLISLGVKAGSHVAIWASNVPQWYITFWATVKIGAVLVTVNTAYKIHEAEYLLKQSDTHTLVMTEGAKDNSYGDIVARLCPELEDHVPGKPLHAKRLPFLRNVISVGFRQKGVLTWEDAMARAELVPKETVYRMAAAVSPDDVCNMQYTSGTTGFPKGVMLTHRNIVNNGKCIGDRMDLSTADRMMIQVPMFHCFGMVLAMTASMTHGVSIYPVPYFNTKASLSCIHNNHITCFHGVPTMFISMLEHADFPKTDFSFMRTGIMAGSPCPISAMRDVVGKMNMTEITIVYGQTESSPGCTMSSTNDPLEVRVATVGGNLPEIECKIVNPETGEDCPDEVTGEFVARGYNLMKGYYKMPKATAAAIDRDGWLHTGDLACRTPEGHYRITGRLKDMIIRGGENIYPKEIEEFIYTHPKVSDVQVIGVPDEQYGEEIMACVILKAGETMTEKEMKDFISASMARHKVPRYIDFVDSFPMNAAGKILKYKMRENAIEKLGLQKAASIVTA